MQTNPRPFLLERYFGIHEFTAKVLLSSSDVESLSVREVLEMSAGDAEAMALWNDLSLGYTESQGHPLPLREIAATYGPNIDPSHILEIAPEEGIFIAMSAIVTAGDNVVVTWPAYQSLFEVAQARGATIRKWNAVDGRRFDLLLPRRRVGAAELLAHLCADLLRRHRRGVDVLIFIASEDAAHHLRQVRGRWS